MVELIHVITNLSFVYQQSSTERDPSLQIKVQG